MEQTSNKTSHHTKLTLEEKSFPPLLPGFELATFRSRARRSNQQTIPAPAKYTQSTKAKHGSAFMACEKVVNTAEMTRHRETAEVDGLWGWGGSGEN